MKNNENNTQENMLLEKLETPTQKAVNQWCAQQVSTSVQIPVHTYNQMQRVRQSYQLLLKAVMESCELGYGCDELRMDDTALNTLLKVLEPEAYEERLRELKDEREAKRRESEE